MPDEFENPWQTIRVNYLILKPNELSLFKLDELIPSPAILVNIGKLLPKPDVLIPSNVR